MKVTRILSTKLKVIGMGAALCGSLFTFSPITAFAGGLDCTCETKCTEDCVNPDCKLCQEDYHNCEGKEPEVEPEEEWGSLTPDGNMTLVDDYGTLEAGGKQFITVTTKSGNFFYIIIDRDDDGNEKVHFLNMVDESDLLSLMDDEEIDKYIAATGIGSEKKEETPKVVTPEPTQPKTEPDEPKTEEKKSTNVNGIMAIILIIALAGAGGYMYFNTTKNSKKKPTKEDPDEGYNEDYLNSVPTETESEDEVPIADEEEIRKAEIQEVDRDE